MDRTMIDVCELKIEIVTILEREKHIGWQHAQMDVWSQGR